MRLARLASVFATLALSCGGTTATKGTEPQVKSDPKEPTNNGGGALEMRTAIAKPKELSKTVVKGLAWLAKHQLEGGGWGQGDEAPGMQGLEKMRDQSNVADTSMAVLAFLRAGHSGRVGEYRDTVQRGVDYVVAEIEKSDDSSLKVTAVTGTRVQMKIGPYADTFAALMMLQEAKGRMKDGVANARVDDAIKKVVRKIEKNQRDDGSWDGQGWAPVLSQAIASKGLNRASQNGFAVSHVVLERVEKQAAGALQGGRYGGSVGGAGVEVYSAAAASSTIRDAASTKAVRAKDMKAKADAAAKERKSPDVPTKAQVEHAEQEAKKASDAAAANEAVLVTRLSDNQFIAGFGNNGGEEFLSYMMISETMAQKGGDQWAKWDAAISQLVDRVQNDDGSWTGHHCITGRTFCTAAALLVLMGDRTPAIAVIAS